MRLFSNISRNFRMILRSKLAPVVVLAPILIFLAVGLAYNLPEQYTLSIAVFSEDYSPLSNNLVSALNQSTLKVLFSQSEAGCRQLVEWGEADSCVLLPPGLNVGNQSPPIKILVDSSKTNLVFVIKDILETTMERLAYSLSSNLTAELIGAIAFSESKGGELKQGVEKATGEIKAAENGTASAIKSLEDMELGATKEDFKLSGIKSDLGIAKAGIRTSITKGKALFTAIPKEFSELEDAVKGLSGLNSSAKSSMLDMLNGSRSSLSTLSKELNQGLNATNASLVKLEGKVGEAEKAVDLVVAALQKNARLRKSSLSGLNLTRKEFNRIKGDLSGINQALLEIFDKFGKIKIREPEWIVQPFRMELETITPSASQSGLLFPQFLAVVIMLSALLIPCLMVVRERTSIAGTRQKLLPTTAALFYTSIYITNILIIIGQLLVISVTAHFLLGIATLANFPLLLFAVFLSGSGFIWAGIWLGRIFGDEQAAMMGAVCIATILLFLSGVILPIESMPPQLSKVSKFSPLVLSMGALRQAVFFSTPLWNQSGEVLAIIGYLFGFIGLVLASQGIERIAKTLQKMGYRRSFLKTKKT